MVNRSVTWADWDEDLLSLELQELNAADFDLSLTGFEPGRSTDFCRFPTRSEGMPRRLFPTIRCPELATYGYAGASGAVRGRLTSEDVARLVGERKPILMVTDSPYGIELDSEWRDRAG